MQFERNALSSTTIITTQPTYHSSSNLNALKYNLFQPSNLTDSYINKGSSTTSSSSEENNSPTELNNCRKILEKPPLVSRQAPSAAELHSILWILDSHLVSIEGEASRDGHFAQQRGQSTARPQQVLVDHLVGLDSNHLRWLCEWGDLRLGKTHHKSIRWLVQESVQPTNLSHALSTRIAGKCNSTYATKASQLTVIAECHHHSRNGARG